MTHQAKQFILNVLWNGKQYNPNVLNKSSKLYLQNKEIIEYIINQTLFLDLHKSDVKMPERYYCILNDIYSLNLCSNPACMNVVKTFYPERSSERYGYGRFCCSKCANIEQDWSEEEMKRRSNDQKNAAVKSLQTKNKWSEEYKAEVSTKIKSSASTVLPNGLTKSKHASNASEKTKLRKYGRCGNVNPELTKQTMIERYGVECIFQTDDAKQKSKSAADKRFIIQRTKYFERCVEYYKTTDIRILCDVSEFIFNKSNIVQFRCVKCETEFDALIMENGFEAKCKLCHVPERNKTESDIFEFVKSLTPIVYRNYFDLTRGKSGRKTEIDIFIPEYACGIEYNGLMWHSFGKSKYSKFNNHEFESNAKNSHLLKTEQCDAQDVQLYHIFENEWMNPTKQRIWKSILLSKLQCTTRIFARKCIILPITNTEAKDFLSQNHIQGHVNSSHCYGLFYQDQLMSVMTFGKSRYNKTYEWELLRFATKVDHTVVGGASKLLKYFETCNVPKSLISYANRRWSQGNVYHALGFNLISKTNANYFYFHESSYALSSREKFQKHMLKDLLSIFDPDKTETENMYDNGYRKIYDSGNLVFAKEYK